MASLKKVCDQCGMPISLGVAECPHCGATVGTLFSETDPVRPAIGKRHLRRNEQLDYHGRIEQAQERANNSVILALVSFFCPGIGFILGVAAIVMSVLAARTLREDGVEDGRGSATAGLIIGVLGLIAQSGYIVYAIKAGKLPFIG